MNLRRLFIHAYLYVPYGFRKITGTGAFAPGRVEYMHDVIQADGNRLKAALLKHHVKQFHESSCSVATVVSAINAIRDDGVETPISQMDILRKVRTAHWKERMSSTGYNGKRGLPLPVLGEVVKSSLDAYGITYDTVEIVQASPNAKRALPIKALLRDRLTAFEKRGDSLIIAHFDQGAYVPTLNIPHISPVGAFDSESGDVVVLDVDPQQEKHYRIPFDTFYRGLSNNYHHIFRPFGYGSGGYVYIKL